MDFEALACEQQGVVSVWQLLDLGWSRRKVGWASRRWRALHQGVWVTGHNTPTADQLHWAARLTTRDSVLSHASAGASFGFAANPRVSTVITRPGQGGRERLPGLLVCHSKLLDGDVLSRPGKPATTSAPRTVLDLVGVLRSEAAQRRVVRDALRVGAVTGLSLETICRHHRGRRGVALLRLFASEYAPLPAMRTRSDAELLAMATLAGAGEEHPDLNVKIAGYEADLVWRDRRVIIELDGPNFHQFESEDALRDAAWSRAGWSVNRISTDVVYDDPNQFMRFARAALLPNRPNSTP